MPISPLTVRAKSDTALVGLVRDGSELAFAVIVDRHRKSLQRHCRALLASHQVDDAVQQTFLRAFLALRSGTDVRELAPWLHRIARNVALSELSVSTTMTDGLDDAWEDCRASGEVERRAELRGLLTALACLPEQQRAVVTRAISGEGHAAIAAELGLTAVSARQILHRARTVLRTAVHAAIPPPALWVTKRLSGLVARVPAPPTAGAPFVPKLIAVVTAAVIVATPVLRHVPEALVHGLSHSPARHSTDTRRTNGPPSGASVATALVTGVHLGPDARTMVLPRREAAGDPRHAHPPAARRAQFRIRPGAPAGDRASARTGALGGRPSGDPSAVGATAVVATAADPNGAGSGSNDAAVMSPTSTGPDPTGSGSTDTAPDSTSFDGTPSDTPPADPQSADGSASPDPSADPVTSDPASTDVAPADPTTTDATASDPTSSDSAPNVAGAPGP